MVEQGLGITLAPKLAISKDYSSLSYRPLIDPSVTRTIGLIKRSGTVSYTHLTLPTKA